MNTIVDTQALPLERLARLENFGHSLDGPAFVYSPTNPAEIAEAFELAQRRGTSVGLRGAGRSYGDAALNRGQIVLDLRGMRRVLEWDALTGVIKVEPGVTIEQLWKYIIGDGWWPPVVPGTMFPTLGGCLAANIHGKNNWVAGTLGEHVLEFEALLPNGRTIACSPEKNTDFFYAMIGGMGLLGVFTSITLKMKLISSGYLEVLAWAEPALEGMLQAVDGNKTADYIVGWMDCSAAGRGLGRGQIHRADYLKPGQDPDPSHSLRIDAQALSDRLFGVFPKAWMPRFMSLVTNNPGAWIVNTGKYWYSRTVSHRHRFRQSLVAFNFLLDYVPGWERMYGRGGMIQYQSFLPKGTAKDAYLEMLRLFQRRGMPSYLGVLKRHRPDKFLLSHALDGFSLALDFRVTAKNRQPLQALTAELDTIVLQAGGRYYFAKDSTLNAAKVRRYLGEETVLKFQKLRGQNDPHGLLETDLYRRCFREPSGF